MYGKKEARERFRLEQVYYSRVIRTEYKFQALSITSYATRGPGPLIGILGYSHA